MQHMTVEGGAAEIRIIVQIGAADEMTKERLELKLHTKREHLNPSSVPRMLLMMCV